MKKIKKKFERRLKFAIGNSKLAFIGYKLATIKEMHELRILISSF